MPLSILKNHAQRSELFRIRIPALRCFGCRIDSRLDGLGAFCCNSLDQRLLVGNVCLRPFECADQFSMGRNGMVHKGLLFL